MLLVEEYDWFDLVWFYGISTIAGYSMLSHVYTFIFNIYDSLAHSFDNIFKRGCAYLFRHR